MAYAGLITFLIVLIFGAPLLTIVCINYLFATGIEITFWNYIAMLWLHLLVASGASN